MKNQILCARRKKIAHLPNDERYNVIIISWFCTWAKFRITLSFQQIEKEMNQKNNVDEKRKRIQPRVNSCI